MSDVYDRIFESSRKREEAILARKVSAYERAMAAAEEQDYKKAYEIIMEALMPQDPGEIYNWGVAYLNGFGVEEDPSTALEWFLEADEAGDPNACKALARIYYNGEGVEKNYVLAAPYMRKAAESGDERFQYYLASMYYNGDGVEKNIDTALEWLSIAAYKMHRRSAAVLGSWYYSGKVVARSYKTAWFWLSKLDSPLDEDEDYYYTVQCLLGMMSLHGKGTSINYEKAISFLESAANHNNCVAQFWLGMMYYSGIGVQQNLQTANTWLQKSAENEFEDAMEFLKADNKRYLAKKIWEKAKTEAEEETGQVIPF